MKEKYTVRPELRIGEVLQIISYFGGINEVKFVYSPLGDILLGDFALRNSFREIEKYYHEGY